MPVAPTVAPKKQKQLPNNQDRQAAFVPLDSDESLLQMGTNIRSAVDELEKLREENAELNQRIYALTQPYEDGTELEDDGSAKDECANVVDRFELLLQRYLDSTEDRDMVQNNTLQADAEKRRVHQEV